jgi:hypothetical protein
MFVELSKLLKDCPFPHIIFVVLANLNSSIDNPHYKLRVVLIFSCVSFVVEVIAYLDAASKDKVVFFIVCSIDLLDGFFHAGSAS